MMLKKQSKILFIGDSITDCSRTVYPFEPFGNGYVHFVGNWLYAKYSELDIKVLNRGISGNTIRSLQNRWQADCIELAPDIVSVLIGINDVWLRHREPHRLPEAVPPDEYEKLYRQLLADASEKLKCQLVLIEPFMFCCNSEDSLFKDLQTYIGIVRNLALEFNAIHIPMQDKLNIAMRSTPWRKWSADMVHPFTWAHAWIAQQWIACSGL